MKPNLKDVLDTEELNRFISLLKDITPYQLKIYHANGSIETLNKEEKQAFDQLKNDLKHYYDKLDKAWFT